MGKLPPVPAHPEPRVMTWSALELDVIVKYGEDCARAALLPDNSTGDILKLVAAERERQDQKWGGPAADDRWSPLDWYAMIADYNGWARRMACMESFAKAKNRYIQVAALAAAAAEAMERKRPDIRIGMSAADALGAG